MFVYFGRYLKIKKMNINFLSIIILNNNEIFYNFLEYQFFNIIDSFINKIKPIKMN